MTTLSRDALSLAGFALAHAVWSVSDTDANDLLCPLAMLELDGQRRLVRFEADTQEAAIARGKEAMLEARAESDAWAFAREGAWRPSGSDREAQDVIIVDCWAVGMDAPVTLFQAFERGTRGREFRLLDTPALAVDGRMVEPLAATPAVDVVLAGVHAHEVATKHWAHWAQGGSSTE